MKKVGKKGMEFNFSWMFAIIVGAIILFLAIYTSSRIIGSGNYEVNTLTAKQITNLLQTAETGVASGVKPDVVQLKEETRVYNICGNDRTFGKQQIQIAGKSFGKWSDVGVEVDAGSRYVFSNSTEQGKTIYYFAKPFEMPWKVSELIFLSTRKFCFINAPENIKDDAAYLMPNLDLNCSKSSIRVCFGSGTKCDMRVQGACSGNCESEYDYGSVIKNGKTIFYTGNLIYGAIFASPEIYECNVKRLAKRISFQAELFKKESDFLVGRCESSSTNIVSFGMNAKALKNSQDLINLRDASELAQFENDASECKLW